jgi:hypothetical protein
MDAFNLNALTTAYARERHGQLLAATSNKRSEMMDNLTNSPLFATQNLPEDASTMTRTIPLQCGLMAEILLEHGNAVKKSPQDQNDTDMRLFLNVTTPSSIFICGSQGSGKSHTLSCLLENCLADSDATLLPRPLSALLFHYDTFISDDGGSPCEAAFLASLPGTRVRVICAPTNLRTIQVG